VVTFSFNERVTVATAGMVSSVPTTYASGTGVAPVV